ncbi:MAG: hypothetical protein B7Z53_01760 [Rhodospirillales bacterium 12-71-4]|nr:MAG: hypothetical protein B7Z53_01760 [Rhodospirillales bacterium 12-71-4]
MEVALQGAAGPSAVASVLLNEVVLGGGPLSSNGQGRFLLPVPAGLAGLENQISVELRRGEPAGAAQLLPPSRIGLVPAGSPGAFHDLPAAYAGGMEVLADAPGGVLVAEQLNPILWVLRRLLAPTAPLMVRLVEPGEEVRPSAPFLAATREPPQGTDPVLRFDAGRILLSNADGRPILDLAGLQRVMAAQLLVAEGQPGLWLRRLGPPPLLPAEAPRLDDGDVALLDGQGVALAWRGRGLPDVRVSYPEEAAPTPALHGPLMPWRPWVVGTAWLAGLALVIYAFIRPRRDARR